MVSTANSQLRQISIVTYYVPIGMAVLGLLLLLGGIVIRLRRRRMLTAMALPTPRLVTPSSEAPTSGRPRGMKGPRLLSGQEEGVSS